MKIGPKYKIARRLGASVFDKTQTPKFAASVARRNGGKDGKKPRPKSEFGTQLIEKQRARFTYGVMEKQFRNYVRKAIAQTKLHPDEALFRALETRLDNVVYRLGLANSRLLARQMVSHGHILINGVKVTIPSYTVSEKDAITIRDGSQKKRLFEQAAEKMKNAPAVNWIKSESEKKRAEIVGMPKFAVGETPFDIGAILEFYKR